MTALTVLDMIGIGNYRRWEVTCHVGNLWEELEALHWVGMGETVPVND